MLDNNFLKLIKSELCLFYHDIGTNDCSWTTLNLPIWVQLFIFRPTNKLNLDNDYKSSSSAWLMIMQADDRPWPSFCNYMLHSERWCKFIVHPTVNTRMAGRSAFPPTPDASTFAGSLANVLSDTERSAYTAKAITDARIRQDMGCTDDTAIKLYLTAAIADPSVKVSWLTEW